MTICKHANIVCIDLLSAFRNAAKSNPEPLYLPLGDMHWNSNGHRVAGITITEFIWQHYLTNEVTGTY
jgi:hypothetical protein